MTHMFYDVRCLIWGMSKCLSVINILNETGLTLRRGSRTICFFGYAYNAESYGLLHSGQNILPSKLLNEIPVSFSTIAL
jgi:hypothetical protein